MSKYRVSVYNRSTTDLPHISYVEAKSGVDAKRIGLDCCNRSPTITPRGISLDSPWSTADEAVAVYRNFQSFRWTGTMGFDGKFEHRLILHRSYPVYAFPVKFADVMIAHEYVRVPDAQCCYKFELVTFTPPNEPVYDVLPNHHKIHNIGRRWVAEGAVNVPENANVRRFVKQYVTDLVKDYMTAQDMMIRDAISKL